MHADGSVVLGQDSDKEGASAPVPIHRRVIHARFGFSRSQREAMKASGFTAAQVEDIEAQMVGASGVAPPLDRAATPINHFATADGVATSEKAAYGTGMHSTVQNTGGLGQPALAERDGTGALVETFTEDELLARAAAAGRRPSATVSPMSAEGQHVGAIATPGTHAPGCVRSWTRPR